MVMSAVEPNSVEMADVSTSPCKPALTHIQNRIITKQCHLHRPLCLDYELIHHSLWRNWCLPLITSSFRIGPDTKFLEGSWYSSCYVAQRYQLLLVLIDNGGSIHCTLTASQNAIELVGWQWLNDEEWCYGFALSFFTSLSTIAAAAL